MLQIVLATLLAQAPVATAPGAPAAAEERSISGTATLGGALLTGNSQSVIVTVGSSVAAKTPDWLYGFKASAAYGRSKDPSTGVDSTSALNGSLALRGARRLDEVVAIYLEGIVEADHMKSIEWRPTGEVGASLQLVDRKEADFQTEALRLDFGVRGGYEYRFQYYPTPLNLPDEAIAAPKAGLVFRHAFTRDTVLGEELTALFNFPDGPRLLLTNAVKLSTRLYRGLSFAISYGIVEDTAPPPGKRQLDTTLTVAFEMTL